MTAATPVGHALAPDPVPVDPAWETWLRANFHAYLMRAARGESRPAEAVAAALARLTNTTGALTRLATLTFLLDPALTRLVCHDLRRFLGQVTPAVRRDEQESRGVARGRIAWARTLARRQQTRDPLLFVTSIARRSFDQPELRLLRWLLDRVLAGIETVRPLAKPGAEPTRWSATLGALHGAVQEAVRHFALRDLPAAPPDPESRRVAGHSRHEFIRAVARALARHDRLLPLPHPAELARVLADHALAPSDPPRRFELYFLMTLAAAVDRVWPGASRRDALIDPDRKEVITWSLAGWTLVLRYDHKSPPGHYSRTLRRAFGLRGVLRPDLRLVLHSPERRTTDLYLDAKLSESDKYLRHSATRMLASLIDRPGAFVTPGPCGVLLTLRPTSNPPDLDSPLAFIAPHDCEAGGPLEHLLRRFMTRAGAPL